MNGDNAAKQSYKEYLAKQNQIRKDKQEKLYAYYSGDEDAVKSYLKSSLKITYRPLDVDEMQLEWVNITKKLVDQLAVVYRSPATRKLKKGETENKELTKYYNELLPPVVNTKDKTAHRFGRLFNTSITQVLFDRLTGKVKYKIIPSYLYDIEVDYDDPLKLTAVKYQKYFNFTGDDELFTVVWTDDENYLLDQDGKKKAIPGNENMTNPFKVLPFVAMIMEEGLDFWGEGQCDAVNVNEQIDLLITKLVNRDIIIGTEGTLYSVNNDVINQKGEFKNGRKEIRIGVSHPFAVENRRSGDLQPASLQHISFNPQIEAIQGFIDWYIKYIASSKGLNPSAILAQLKETSDYQRMMDAVDQMELRKDDIEICRLYEKERFKITKIVNNTFIDSVEGKKFGLKKIDDDIEMMVDFAEVEIQMTPADKQAKREFEYTHNMSNEADWMVEDNPDMTLEDAKKKLLENAELKRSTTERKSLFDNLINQNNGDQNAKTGQ